MPNFADAGNPSRLKARRRALRILFETLERRRLMAGVVINEFLTSNDNGIVDQDSDHSDWIELRNTDPAPANLTGWYLTDDAEDLTKWDFPSTSIPAGGYLTVFASGKDRAVPGQELHTNFALAVEGEYLALVMPDGTTVAQDFGTEYPPQRADISYGLGQVVNTLPLVTPGAATRAKVPTNNSLDAVWNTPGYTPDASWTSGPMGVGYGQTFNGFLVKEYQANIAAGSPIGTTLDNIGEVMTLIDTPAAYTSVAAGNYATVNFRNAFAGNDVGTQYTANGVEFPGQTSATNYSHVATEAHAQITIPTAGPWTFGIDHNEGYLLRVDEEEFSLDPGTGSTERFHTMTFDSPGTYDLDLYHFERTGSSYLKLYAAPGTFTSFNAAAFDLVGDVANGGLAVKSNLVGSNGLSIAGLIGTNVQAQMQNVNSTVYTRTLFNVADPSGIEQLLLRMKYDDAFVVYLNGIEVARQNVAGSAWNTTATNARTGDEALTYEDFNVSAFISALVPGQNVLAIQCVNKTAADPDAVIMPELIGTDDVSGTTGYFTTPTPGGANGDASIGFVADTTFDQDRGFFDAPFQLAITTTTPDAQIYYTINGETPTESTGILYNGAITIDKTTVLRAAAFKPGFIQTNVDTQTYLFVNDIVQQTAAKTVQLGFPTTWGTSVPNTNFPAAQFPDGAGYGLDPDIIGNFDANGNPIGGDLYGGIYAAGIKDSLKSIPTLSIVADFDDLFAANTGIITNASQRGVAWERPASIEWITTDTAPEFQIDAGLRIQGAFFRSNSNNLKKSFRLLFKDIYGAGKLDFPLFGEGSIDSFNGLVLRGGGNDGYSWNSAKLTEQFTRDEFMRNLQEASGNVSPHGNFAHLYINGVYWGLYNPVERPDADFAASYLGGNPDNYDIIHRGGGAFEAQQGDRLKWDEMMAMAQLAVTDDTAYMQLQGKLLDGSDDPDPNHAPLIDLVSYVDYLVVQAWGGNWDWPRNNYWAARDRDQATSKGFYFFNWDGENTMLNNNSRSPLNKDVFDPSQQPGIEFGQDGSNQPLNNAGRIHSLLKNNPHYRQLYADRTHRLFFNGGILTPGSLIPRFQAVSDYVEDAIIAESARWGDMQAHRSPSPNRALTPADWIVKRDEILNTYLPQRTSIVLNQWKTLYNLYPTLDAPTYVGQFGGAVPNGHSLEMTGPAGATIYYTTDGADPRLFGGAVNFAHVQEYTGNPLTINSSTRVQARAYDPNTQTWSALVDATYLTTVGYPIRLSEVHYNPGAGAANSDKEFIELVNTSNQPVDLLGVKVSLAFDYTFTSSLSLGAGQRIVIARNPTVFQQVYGSGINLAPGSGYTPQNLSDGGEPILIEGPLGEKLADFSYDDVAPWPIAADGSGPSLEIIDPLGSPADPANWRASANNGGSPGTAGLIPPAVTDAAFQPMTGHSIAITFDHDMNVASFDLTDIEIRPQGQPGATPINAALFSYVSGTKTATFGFAPYLADGSYTAKLVGGSVSDSNGTAFGSAYSFNFFILTGDINHDGDVDTADFTQLAAHFNQTGATWAEGDFNYDNRVNALDFNALASKFGSVAAGPVPGAAPLAAALPDQPLAAAPAGTAPGSLFGDKKIVEDEPGVLS